LIRPLALASLLLLAACGAGPEQEEGALSGECAEDGAVHCVSSSTIQYCLDGAWDEPEECPPEQVGSDFPVEVQTYCSEDGCRPGG